MKLETINLGSIWTMLAGTAMAVAWMFATFASAADLNDVKVSVWYGQFYDRLDDRDEAVDEGNEELAKEYERQMEKLLAQICEVDPEWERCKE